MFIFDYVLLMLRTIPQFGVDLEWNWIVNTSSNIAFFPISFRFNAVLMQEPLPPATVQENRRGRFMVEEREKSGLCHHIPDALDFAEIHAAL